MIKHKCDSVSFAFVNSIHGMKMWLTKTRPIAIRLLIYDDFYSYKSGIYSRISNTLVGGHGVKLIGYGYDKKKKINYWICQNIWGSGWGMEGFFYIKEDEVVIEAEGVSCLPYN